MVSKTSLVETIGTQMQGSTCVWAGRHGSGVVPGSFVLLVEPLQFLRHRLRPETAATIGGNQGTDLCYVQRVVLEPERCIPTAAKLCTNHQHGSYKMVNYQSR